MNVKIVSVGVGSSGVGEGVTVAVARSAGVAEADTTGRSSVAVAGIAISRLIYSDPGQVTCQHNKYKNKTKCNNGIIFFHGSLLAINYPSFWNSNQ